MAPSCRRQPVKAKVRFVSIASFYKQTISEPVLTSQLCHVWTAPGWQENVHVAGLVGAAMCSAFMCGSQTRAVSLPLHSCRITSSSALTRAIKTGKDVERN